MSYKQQSNDNNPAVFQTLPPSVADNLEIFDLKQLADKEALYKARCQHAIRHYKNWCKAQADQTDMIEILYGSMEARFYRCQAEETVHLYWAIRRHFRKAFALYINKTGYYPKAKKRAA